MKRRDVLKFLFGSLFAFVVPVKSEAEVLKQGKFVTLCNLAISHEYEAICQYINHSGIIKDENVKKILEMNMNDEVFHARSLTEILIKEGATPTVAIWPPRTGIKFGKLIEEDIGSENQSMKLYSMILGLKESFKYRDLIYSFLKREELHRSRLVGILNAKETNK